MKLFPLLLLLLPLAACGPHVYVKETPYVEMDRADRPVADDHAPDRVSDDGSHNGGSSDANGDVSSDDSNGDGSDD